MTVRKGAGFNHCGDNGGAQKEDTTRTRAPSSLKTDPEQITFPFHAKADIFPRLEGREFDDLVVDIKQHGLRDPITVIYNGKADGGDEIDASNSIIIEGRNRYLACLKAGVEQRFDRFLGEEKDIVPFITSKNIHRRHLTAEQKRDLSARLLDLHPEKSDRQIGKIAKVDGKTVAKVRREKEARAEIPHVEKRTDAKGRKQSVKRTKAGGIKSRGSVKKPASDAPDGSPATSDEGEAAAVQCHAAPVENVQAELTTLREFAAFVLARTEGMKTDPKDYAKWKELRDRVKGILHGRSS
jgi:hypothetical protein